MRGYEKKNLILQWFGVGTFLLSSHKIEVLVGGQWVVMFGGPETLAREVYHKENAREEL